MKIGTKISKLEQISSLNDDDLMMVASEGLSGTSHFNSKIDISALVGRIKDRRVLSYWYSSDTAYISSKTYNLGDKIAYPGLQDISSFKRDFHTLLSGKYVLEPPIDYSEGISSDQRLYILDIENTINAAINPDKIKYDGNNHKISLDITFTPSADYCSVYYYVSGTQCLSVPEIKDVGKYQISTVILKDDYRDFRGMLDFEILKGGDYIVTFNYQKYDKEKSEILDCTKPYAVERGKDVSVDHEISASDEYFDFQQFDSYAFLSVTDDVIINSIKTPHQYIVKFHDDPCISVGLISCMSSVYRGSVEPPPNPSAENYAFEYWTEDISGYEREETTSYLSVEHDLDIYSWMRRLYGLSSYVVYDGEVGNLSTFENIKDGEYVKNGVITPIEISGFTFDHWQPAPTENGWFISCDTYISAVYRPESDNGTVHYSTGYVYKKLKTMFKT